MSTASSEPEDRGSCKTNHLVLVFGNAVMQAFSTSTFATAFLREHALDPMPSRAIECASTTETHSCQKRSFPKRIDQNVVCKLYDEMPNVTKLEVLCAPVEFAEECLDTGVATSIMCLASHWSKSLSTLKMLFLYEPEQYSGLLETIANLEALRHLTLEIDQRANREDDEEENSKSSKKSDNSEESRKSSNSESSSKCAVKGDLSVLSKLEEFFYRAPIISQQLIESLKKFGEHENSKLKRIGIGNESGITGPAMDELSSKLSRSLTCRFVYVPAIHRPFSADKLASFAFAFHKITSLDLDSAELSLLTIASCLSPLNELICLRLTNAFTHLEHPLVADDQVPAEQIAQLVSVRSLTVEVFAKSHAVLKSVHWGRVFPGLLEAHVTNRRTNCSLCDGASRTSFTKPSAESKLTCTRHLLSPLKQCPQLQCTFPLDIVAGDSDGDKTACNKAFVQPDKQ